MALTCFTCGKRREESLGIPRFYEGDSAIALINWTWCSACRMEEGMIPLQGTAPPDPVPPAPVDPVPPAPVDPVLPAPVDPVLPARHLMMIVWIRPTELPSPLPAPAAPVLPAPSLATRLWRCIKTIFGVW